MRQRVVMRRITDASSDESEAHDQLKRVDQVVLDCSLPASVRQQQRLAAPAGGSDDGPVEMYGQET